MEAALVTAVIALAVACLVLAVACAALSASVPWLWSRVLRLDAKVSELDENLSHALGAAGLDEGRRPAVGGAVTPSNGWAPSRPASGSGPMNVVSE